MQLDEAQREHFYEQLKLHHADEHLTTEELERRVEVVHHAQTREEAAAVLADLPRLAPPAPERQRVRWGRGHGDADQPAADWEPTHERFRDPRTNKVMRVWVDPHGGRHYVRDDEA